MIDTVTTVERNDLILPKPDGGPNIGSGRRYGYLRLRLDRKIPVLPGQFAMIKPHGIYEPLLRRAMAYYRSVTVGAAPCVDFIYQILGRGTQALANLRPGDKVDFLGSLGNTYDVEAARGREALLVAGGVGSAALFMLAEELVKMGARVKLFVGGASRGDLCGLDDFIELLREENVICATVDGSLGEASFVTAPLERHLQRGGGPADDHIRLRPRPDVTSRRADRRAVRRAVADLARSADGLRLWRLRRLRGRGQGRLRRRFRL